MRQFSFTQVNDKSATPRRRMMSGRSHPMVAIMQDIASSSPHAPARPTRQHRLAVPEDTQ